ncbi:MAG TPA: triple tyrosine motif-containing protein, partial [Cryomorphaceae bacterium]|nr:triple tyrosine motif-containing protein [Cryomorphaceae bacterium]
TAPDGSLYFGGTAGLTIIHPEEFYKNQSPSTTLITGIKLQNKPLQFIDGSSGILKAPIHASTYLELPYDHRMFSFRFANLDLSSPAENEFKYMLEGFDQKWIDVGTATEATYTNLNPGKYTFKVLGRNSFKNWNQEATTIDIAILSPWWGTWWFRALVLLFVVSTIYGLYKYRLNQLMEVERMRNQIAQDLHDEIGSTLSSISLYSAVMKKTVIDISPKSQSILDRIIHNVSDIMEKMNDMVWTIKSDNDSMDQVVNRMRAFAAEMAEAKAINLDFHSEDSVSKIQLAMDRRKEIYLIFKEAVNNAVKYSAASKLSVRLYAREGGLKMSIRDDGKGFELNTPKDKASGGNGLIGMQRRAARMDAEWKIDSKLGKGTTVDLNVPINH